MSRGPENNFRAAVHKYLDSDLVYNEKMHNPLRGGTADDWYSGRVLLPHNHLMPRQTRDLWIEWKFIVVPQRDGTLIDLVGGKDPDISALQQEWIKARHAEGRNVWVGVGSKDGGVFFENLAWLNALTAREFRTLVSPRKALAAHITEFVQGVS